MVRLIIILILCIFWGTMSLLVYAPHAPLVKDLPESDKNIVITIFILGGPIFAMANVLEQLLDCFMPPGWGGDEDDFINKW